MTRHKIKRRQAAFTIVELLIVIVVIAVLAAISIVAYTGIQNRANNAAAEADAANVSKQLALAKVDLGRYPHTYAEFPSGLKFSKTAYDATQNNVYYCVDRQNDLYAVGLRTKNLKGYIINTGAVNPTGVVSSTGGVSGASTCDAINKTCTNDATTFCVTGYNSTTSTWNTSWGWTN